MSGALPTVSIVITCYNYARYVSQAIESALRQSHRALEIIVVDDGSTDESMTVIERHAARVTLIRQSNAGHVAAVNRGYEASTGDLVLFLDADDVLRTDALEHVVSAWERRCAKVQFELDVIDAEGRSLGRRFCNYTDDYDSDRVEREFREHGTYVWPVLSGNAYSRWYLDMLMPLRISRSPDGFLNTLAPLYGVVRVIPKALGCYRLHDSNLNYGADPSDFARRFATRVSLRASELAHLKRHAAERAVALPSGNLLDRDLTFINYRLMLKRLGAAYENSSTEGVVALWQAAFAMLLERPMPARMKLMHATWFIALSCSPRWLAKRLIRARFQRGSAKRSPPSVRQVPASRERAARQSA